MTGLPQQSYLCPVTIGRSPELEALETFLNREGGVLRISGDAGIGKSRLVREARSLAEARGIRVLEGRCFEADHALPFAPAPEILSELVGRLGATEVARLAGPAAPELARLHPELSSGIAVADTDHVDQETAKRRLLDGFARLLKGIANEQRLLLVVEDIHWPDASSLDLFLHLARYTERERLFLLLTYRDDEVHPDLEHLLATLDRERLGTEIRLRQLDAGQVAAMLQAILGIDLPVPAALLHAVYALTEGNPFFIEEVLTAIGTEQRVVTADGGWTQSRLHHPHIPRSIHDAVQQRLIMLSDPARYVLTVAAVAGRRFDFDLLGALTGFDEAALLELMKELVAARVVVEETGDRFFFRHALTREAIYAGLLDRERRLRHRQVAETIERLYATSLETRLDDLAAHSFAAGSWAQAFDAAHRAGTRAAGLHAPRAAVEQFTRALEAARALKLPPDPEIHQERGRAHETLGEFESALADYTTALDLARTAEDVRGQWETLLELGLLWSSRDYRHTGQFVTEALAVARTLGDPATVARSLNRVGNWRLNIEDPAEATRLHQEALAIFEAIGDDRGIAESLDLLGMVGLIGANRAASAAAYERAVRLWRTLGDQRGLAAALLGLTWQGPMFHADTVPTTRPVEEIREIGMQCIALCQQIDWRVGECWCQWGFLGMTLGAAGEYELAVPGTRQALQIAREIEHRQWMVATRCMLGNLYADLGDLAAAKLELESAVESARQMDSPYWSRSAIGWLTSILVRGNELDAAVSFLGQELKAETPMNMLAGRLLWSAAAELALAQNEPARTLEVVERLVATTPGGTHRPIARLELLRGKALAKLGRHEQASTALMVARDEAAWSGARPLLWRIEAARGRLAQGRGEGIPAARARANARAIINALAARVPDEALRSTLLAAADREVPLPPASVSGDAVADLESPLTKREREVATLLTEGLTNREIGERLFLSEWTIATHVRNILAKLDLSSRTQIAAWAASRRVAPDA
jgi:DNA-binding CsgD family transcriptional regulator/tetratricopeptide (TPR) repeat protein